MKKKFVFGIIIFLVACTGATFQELDPVWKLSPFYHKTATDIAHWDQAYQIAISPKSSTYTKFQSDSAIAAQLAAINYVKSWNSLKGDVHATTTNLPEGINQYWTQEKGDARYYSKAKTDSLLASIIAGNVDLSNYYNKQESDALFTATQNTISLMQSSIASLQNIVILQQQWIDSSKAATISEEPQVLPDAALILWDYSKGFNATVTITGLHTIKITNDKSGKYGSIVVVQNSTGNGFDINIPTGDISTDGGTKLALNHTNNSINVLSWFRFGSARLWSHGYYH